MSEPESDPLATIPPRRRAKTFRDPVHDLIYFGPEDLWLIDVIASKEFQRLRRIRQLGMAHFAYPGAEHSRFVHSLGVFDVARRMIRKLLHRHDDEPAVRDELKRNMKTIKTAALVHDLGHGPFSHVFERVFRESGAKVPKHDAWSCKIIRDEETEIHGVLVSHGIYLDEVCSLISDDEVPPQHPYLKDIVSSQLDADRMDYLLRDSLMTGSKYGQFDAEWILNALVLADVALADRKVTKLCLDASKGTGAIEGLLFARAQMHRYVYGHKTTRAYEAELVQTLRLALRVGRELPDDTPQPVRVLFEKKGDVAIKEYLLLDDEVLWWAFRRWAASDVAAPRARWSALAALKKHSLRLVRRQTPWSQVPVGKGEPMFAAIQLLERLASEDNPLQYECFVDTLEELPYKDFQHYQRGGKGTESSFFNEIHIVDKEKAQRLSSLTEGSPVLEGLSRRTDFCRFYFNREFEREFAGLRVKFGVC